MKLQDLIQSGKPVLLDGGMGTQLIKRGLEPGGLNNLSNPEAVLSVHREYIKSGSRILITNTLTMNRISLESHDLNIDLREVNAAGVKLAKQACAEAPGAERFVLGDISSTGQLLEPYGTYSEEAFYDTFREQAGILAECGVDGFIIETMFDLREMECAVRACKDTASLPIIATLTFSTVANGCRTIMGNSAADFAQSMNSLGVAAIGTNCGELDPLEVANVITILKELTPLPLVAQPNAGKPSLINGQTVYDMTPASFGTGVAACLKAGAQFVGGCCGTSPDHIREIQKIIGEN